MNKRNETLMLLTLLNTVGLESRLSRAEKSIFADFEKLNVEPPQPKERSYYDLEAIEKARIKRLRKAKRKSNSSGL